MRLVLLRPLPHTVNVPPLYLLFCTPKINASADVNIVTVEYKSKTSFWCANI